MTEKVKVKFSEIPRDTSLKCLNIANRVKKSLDLAIALQVCFKVLELVIIAVVSLVCYSSFVKIQIFMNFYNCGFLEATKHSQVAGHMRIILYGLLLMLVLLYIIERYTNCSMKDIRWALKVKEGVKETIMVAVHHAIALDLAEIVIRKRKDADSEFEALIELEDNVIKINGIPQLVLRKRLTQDYYFTRALETGRLDSFDKEFRENYDGVLEIVDVVTKMRDNTKVVS